MSDYGKCFPECRCGGDGYVERGPSGATYSYPCYSWDCNVPGCRCKDPDAETDDRIEPRAAKGAA